MKKIYFINDGCIYNGKMNQNQKYSVDNLVLISAIPETEKVIIKELFTNYKNHTNLLNQLISENDVDPKIVTGFINALESTGSIMQNFLENKLLNISTETDRLIELVEVDNFIKCLMMCNLTELERNLITMLNTKFERVFIYSERLKNVRGECYNALYSMDPGGYFEESFSTGELLNDLESLARNIGNLSSSTHKLVKSKEEYYALKEQIISILSRRDLINWIEKKFF